MTQLASSKDDTKEIPQEAVQALAHAMSSFSNGVIDELTALLRTSVLHLNDTAIPTLTNDWYEQLDILVLDDMDSCWGLQVDPTGKYGMSDYVRATLNEEWGKNSDGWFLVNHDPDDAVYEFAEFDEWRDAFEHKEQTRVDTKEGVGRFGI